MDALEQEGLHLVDIPAELGRPMFELGAEHDKLEKCETMFRFRGGFHCRRMEGVRIEGLYTCGRDQFTEPDTAFVINSSSGMRITQLEDFRVKVLRGTHVPSIRHVHGLEVVGPCCRTQLWNDSEHASASPFEARAKRASWLDMPLEFKSFGRGMLATGCL